MNAKKFRFRLTPARIVLLSFLLMIVLGTALLSLPFASRRSGGAPLETALFTAVSAVCVTGLVVQDTAQYWTGFGQGVILCLIQVGGMGVVTMAVLLMMFSGKKIGLRQRFIMQESISAPQVGGIVRMTGMILKVTLCTELSGALLFATRLCPRFGLFRGLWMSLFHSVSAFCNAGFDLMGSLGTPFSSLTAFSGDAIVNITAVLLILIGGLGFWTWRDIQEHGRHLKRYSAQSKLILAASGVLIVGGFLFMFFYELRLQQWQALGLSEPRLAVAALFHTVTPRTAGFNTLDLSVMSPAGQLVTLAMMLIGGAPGSTAGGFKLTTIAVLVLCVRSVFQGKDSVYAFGRRIPEATVRAAAALFVLYILLFLGVGLFIACFEGIALMPALFESASAIATVGLSLGLTPGLSTLSHILLMLLMVFGRVGGLTLIYAVSNPRASDGARFPQEAVAVG